MADVTRFLVKPATAIRDVMAKIGLAKGLALVVDSENRLLGTVTDGDIRRAILTGVDTARPVGDLLEMPRSPDRAKPLTASASTPTARLLQMMSEAELRHIPLLNDSGQVVDVAVLEEMVKDYELPFTAVIMAGGQGARLRPLTETTPKPMLPVGGKPLLEHTIDQLRLAGIRRVEITTHYLGEVIREHFGDGSNFGVAISYLQENEPLGTAGALGLREKSDEPILVVNGDVLSQLDVRAMLDFHNEHHAAMTVAVRRYQFEIPFGVVKSNGVDIVGISEKPTVSYLINAGIYVLSGEALSLVPPSQHYNMTDLIHDLITVKRRVVGFPIEEYWMDIGRLGDYEKAQADSQALQGASQ